MLYVKINSNTRVDFTPAVGSSYASYGGCYYETMGRLVHVHLGVSGLTSGASNALYTLPAALRPSNTIFDVASAGGAGKFSGVEIRVSGAVVAVPNGTYCGADVVYFI